MCTCIQEINKQLEEQNTQIFQPLIITSATGKLEVCKHVYVKVEKIDTSKHKGPVNLSGAYCPFCGKLYEGE